MKKQLAAIGIMAVSFGLSAASCDPVPPVVEQAVSADEQGIDQGREATPAPSGPWVREGATFNLLMRPTADVRVHCLALGGEPAFIPGNVVDPSYGEAKVYVCLNVPSSTITD